MEANYRSDLINLYNSALVIMDVQGKLAQMMFESKLLHEKIKTLIKGAELLAIPIFWLEQIPEKIGNTSNDIAELLTPNVQPIAKKHFSAWKNDDFKQALEHSGKTHLLVAGIEAHICVYQTCKDLQNNGFQTHIVRDAISSRTETNKVCGIKMMLDCGANLSNVESALFELQHVAEGERFRQLIKLVK
ncbi:isochorismatase family protein [Shewanella sp. 202IG2-18]|uniref:isochorismatase family protein n=1 Tax=Parashewanella hymeniacidonis TaxID=2807618 RepID=UPI0019616B93|nr:isochorismatase family protein [Parashewanella hymeniacidonis]MBM7071301.1 isochorismatase family protein [Parashewanella hymeniacidonis]